MKQYMIEEKIQNAMELRHSVEVAVASFEGTQAIKEARTFIDRLTGEIAELRIMLADAMD